MKNRKLIIFDLDGVLVNSIKNMEFALKNTNKKLALNLKFNEYKKYIGLPFKKILKKIGVKRNFDEIEKYYKFFSKKKISKIKLTKKTFKDLNKLSKNYTLAVFTSKDRERTHKILNKLKIFKCIVSSEDVNKGKPNKEGVLKILKKTKISKKNCLYVGDSYYDFRAASNAGTKYCHAIWGYDRTFLNNKNIKKIKYLSDISKFF